jgi:hypothetical protein
MKKSVQVSLTVLAAMAAAKAQTAPNPCLPANFNEKACQTAVKSHGYCSGGAWVSQQFQKYPYYYDFYQAYSSAGGQAMAAPVETCRHVRGGFGAIGAAFHNAGS